MNNSYGVAFQEALELLEWDTLCEHLSTFASTLQGKYHCKNLVLPVDIVSSRRHLKETLEIGDLDELIEGGLSFQGIHDLKSILERCLKGGIVSGEELLKVSQTLRSARTLRRQIDDPDSRPITSSLLENLKTLPDLERLIEYGLEEGGRVADRASEKLYKVRYQLYKLRSERREILRNLLRKYSSILQDTVVAERYGRPVIALKVGTNDQIAGTVHDTSSSGNTIFLEPKVVIGLGNQITQVEATIFEEEQRLLALWSNAVGENFQELDHLVYVMLTLDLALTRARYGKWMNGVTPDIQEQNESPFFIQRFRHPLLIWKEKYEQGESVVPISFEINPGLRVVAITGPNTGGKTVALKSIGLAALMTRCGFLLPCTGTPSLPWFNQVLADIGDEQSLQQSLSTFSGHIVRIGRIMEALVKYSGPSMVLLDEVGAGTDPTEGTSIAIALLKVLADRARLTVATTHFGELKALKYHDSRFENASVAFDSETIKPTYHLQWGIPGRSNAIAIAKRLGLDSVVIEKAQNLIKEKNVEGINEIIKGLETERQRHQEAAEDAASLLARTELLHEELLDRWEKQKKKSEAFQEQARQKLEISIREGQKEVRTLIRRLRDEGANGEIARTTGQRLRQIENSHRPTMKQKNRRVWNPKIGDQVRLISIGKAGKVVDISEDGLHFEVLCGIFRSSVEISAIESLDGLKPIIPESVVSLTVNRPLTVGANIRTKRNTVDVRGLRVHEAEVVVEEKLRLAVGPVWVVHGIGTGKLKRGLRDWLKTIQYVTKVVDADSKDGGPGCSVIWIE
tara:strand:+ start:18397 stop:20790 length:2394 start_codon:yes stop_codon:yes gene_type:complete